MSKQTENLIPKQYTASAIEEDTALMVSAIKKAQTRMMFGQVKFDFIRGRVTKIEISETFIPRNAEGINKD